MRNFTRFGIGAHFPLSVFLSIGFLSIGLLWGCGESPDHPGGPVSGNSSPPPPVNLSVGDTFSVTLAKWPGDRRAAISLTYDHGLRWLSPDEQLIRDIIAEEQVPMDFDFTNSDLDEWPARRTYYLETLLPKGIGMFGHGYDHINSDQVSEDSARRNFRRCYDDMLASGLKPIAYAYPGGFCYAGSTRRALEASGFLSGRRFFSGDRDDPYICSEDEVRPKDWFNLPSLVMFAADFTDDPRVIHNTSALIPFLDGAVERRGWLITTYHEIKDGPGGTYRVGDFRNDIAAIKGRDFWIASFNKATLYLREREHAQAAISTTFGNDGSVIGGELLLADHLPNDFYDYPLTVRLSVPGNLIGRTLTVRREGRILQSVLLSSGTLLLSLLPDEQPYILDLH